MTQRGIDDVRKALQEEIRYHEVRLASLRGIRSSREEVDGDEPLRSLAVPDEEIDMGAVLSRLRAVHTRASAVIYLMPGIMAPQIRCVLDAWGVPVRGDNALDKLRASLWKRLDPRGDLANKGGRYYFKSPAARRRFRRRVLRPKV